MGGSNRGMYIHPHTYILRNCFDFCHSTTLSRRKRVSKVTRNMTSNSGFVRSAEFLPHGHHISKRGYLDRVISNCAWNSWQFWTNLDVLMSAGANQYGVKLLWRMNDNPESESSKTCPDNKISCWYGNIDISYDSSGVVVRVWEP